MLLTESGNREVIKTLPTNYSFEYYTRTNMKCGEITVLYIKQFLF